jgi:peptide/nickel transport system substrate-binding protein
MPDRSGEVPSRNEHLSRRQFLQRGGATAAGATSLALIAAACGSTSSTTSHATASSSSPRRGGTLKLASVGGSSSDTLDAQNALNIPDFPRVLALYSPLMRIDANAQLQPALATEFIPNKDSTLWTIRLRRGVVFHDGSPFTAADVLYSFRRMANPKTPLPGASFLAPLDLKATKLLDPHTLQIPCHKPYSIFPEAIANDSCLMVPTGYDPKHPIGTGPFKYESFTPGVESQFTRFEDYWVSGQPYADTLVVSDYQDSTAQANALVSGGANLADYLNQGSVSTINASGAAVIVSHTGNYNPITMRADVPPFNDVRVRQAFRLIADRPQFLNSMFGGAGTAANDVFSIYDPAYDHSLPQRQQDIPQAKALLKAAGREDLSVTLVTSSGIAPVVLSEATVFAQQASAAGVKVTIRQVDATVYWAHYYKKVPLSQDNWSYAPYLIQVASELLPTSPYNETSYDNPAYTKLYNEALAAAPSQQEAIIHEMQSIDYNSGALLIPYFAPMFDGVGQKVGGVVPSRVGIPLDNYNTGAFWID